MHTQLNPNRNNNYVTQKLYFRSSKALRDFDPLNLENDTGSKKQFDDVENKILCTLGLYDTKSLLNQKITAIFKKMYTEFPTDNERLDLLIDRLFELCKTYGGVVHLLGAYYHQDVWDDHPSHTHEEVWLDFIENNDLKAIESLKHDFNEMLQWTNQEIFNFFVEDVSGGLRLDAPEEAQSLLEEHKKQT